MFFICAKCGRKVRANPRVKEQKYCGEKSCQKARKAEWQRAKMMSDPDYKENQERCQKEWIKQNPDYYKEYRKQNPEYTERNRVLQIRRNAKRGKDKTSKLIAKMDTLNRRLYLQEKGIFKLIPQDKRLIAKKDTLIVKLISCKSLEMQRGGFV